MNKKLIIGNWKMSPVTLKEAKQIFTRIKKHAGGLRNVQTVICPPALYLSELTKMVTGHRCVIGGQDGFWDREGAHTGEVSSAMIAGFKTKYMIAGHSERRAAGETDEQVNKKVRAALDEKLTVILCVGETERDDNGEYTRFVARQLKEGLRGVNRTGLKNVIVAYEPVWAIGKNAERPATPEDVVEIAIVARKTLTEMYDKQHALATPLLYGGSVNDQNAGGFLALAEVSGLLVGRASLKPDTFTGILDAAEQSTS